MAYHCAYTPGGVEIRRHLRSLGSLIVRPIPKSLARTMVESEHYSHSWNFNFGTQNLGIFRAEAPEICLGVATFGPPKNPGFRPFEHPDARAFMLELNRLWIDDCLGHNAESFLLGCSLRLLRRLEPDCVLIQSFADGRLGCGTIYKAANFRFFGWHWSLFFHNRRTGQVLHEQILSNSQNTGTFLRANIDRLLGHLVPFRVKTYRYLYPLDRRTRILLQEQPFPPYERGESPETLRVDKEKICRRINQTLERILKQERRRHAGGVSNDP